MSQQSWIFTYWLTNLFSIFTFLFIYFFLWNTAPIRQTPCWKICSQPLDSVALVFWPWSVPIPRVFELPTPSKTFCWWIEDKTWTIPELSWVEFSTPMYPKALLFWAINAENQKFCHNWHFDNSTLVKAKKKQNWQDMIIGGGKGLMYLLVRCWLCHCWTDGWMLWCPSCGPQILFLFLLGLHVLFPAQYMLTKNMKTPFFDQVKKWDQL